MINYVRWQRVRGMLNEKYIYCFFVWVVVCSFPVSFSMGNVQKTQLLRLNQNEMKKRHEKFRPQDVRGKKVAVSQAAQAMIDEFLIKDDAYLWWILSLKGLFKIDNKPWPEDRPRQEDLGGKEAHCAALEKVIRAYGTEVMDAKWKWNERFEKFKGSVKALQELGIYSGLTGRKYFSDCALLMQLFVLVGLKPFIFDEKIDQIIGFRPPQKRKIF